MTITRQLVLIAVIVALAAILIFAGPAACNKIRSMAAQARVQHAQTEALSNSANDAVGTVARSGEAERASEELTRTNEQQIRAAEGANDKVNPAVRDAGIAALCRRAAYRDDPRCKR